MGGGEIIIKLLTQWPSSSEQLAHYILSQEVRGINGRRRQSFYPENLIIALDVTNPNEV